MNWQDLPVFEPGERTTVLSNDFVKEPSGWPTGRQPTASLAFRDGGYQIAMTTGPRGTTVAAPITQLFNDEVVSATGRLLDGQGMWGVWCRGTDRNGTDRYEFLLSHTGAVRITDPSGGGPQWVYLDGIDPQEQTTITARCADSRQDGLVRLTLTVNGREVLTYSPKGTHILGPGYRGVEVMAFGDVKGPRARTVLTRFELSQAARPTAIR